MSEVISRRPELVRDSSWLAGSDLVVIFLGLIGQAFLASNLMRSDYGLMIVLIDAFALMLLLVDAGLPTIISRDAPRARHQTKSLVLQTFRIQIVLSLLMLPIGLVIGFLIWSDSSKLLLLACAGIAVLHVFTYAPRSALRALGEARKEAVVKLIERFVTTLGYGFLAYLGSSNPTFFALVFLTGVITSLAYAIMAGSKHWNHEENFGKNDEECNILLPNKELIISALPFAITLGVIPLIGRFEKILISLYHDNSQVAIFHVAFLAYLAGLTLPQAIRAALLPILGELRNDKEALFEEVRKARRKIFWLVPIGLLGGAILVKFLMEIAFTDYVDESYKLFLILLIGWGITMITAPNYVAVQAGPKPWNFTIMLFIGVGCAMISAFALIPTHSTIGAAWSSVIGAISIGMVAMALSGEFQIYNINFESE